MAQRALGDYKVSRSVKNQIKNIQEVWMSHRSESPDPLTPSITVALRCRLCLSDCYGLIKREVMCPKTVDVDPFQDFIASCQNRSDKRQPGYFAVVI